MPPSRCTHWPAKTSLYVTPVRSAVRRLSLQGIEQPCSQAGKPTLTTYQAALAERSAAHNEHVRVRRYEPSVLYSARASTNRDKAHQGSPQATSGPHGANAEHSSAGARPMASSLCDPRSAEQCLLLNAYQSAQMPQPRTLQGQCWDPTGAPLADKRKPSQRQDPSLGLRHGSWRSRKNIPCTDCKRVVRVLPLSSTLTAIAEPKIPGASRACLAART